MTREIERAIAFFVRRRDTAKHAAPPPADRASFRATVDLRLSNLERQLDEVKGRVNGLLFLLAGAVATQVVLRLFG
jgi:hypothetical protein